MQRCGDRVVVERRGELAQIAREEVERRARVGGHRGGRGEGWVRERGLYFAAEWAPAYEALLAMADPGEPTLEGALLSARVGEGRHTHVALDLHHQLEALVPGAYRLFANLLAPAR